MSNETKPTEQLTEQGEKLYRLVKASKRFPVEGVPNSLEDVTFRTIDRQRPVTNIWKFHPHYIELCIDRSMCGEQIPYTNIEWFEPVPQPTKVTGYRCGLCGHQPCICNIPMGTKFPIAPTKVTEQSEILKKELSFARWLENNTEVINNGKITLYRYCDKNNEWGNYILDDIFQEYCESMPEQSTQIVPERSSILKCKRCGQYHGLQDTDAGSDREIERLCEKCFQSTQIVKEGEPFLRQLRRLSVLRAKEGFKTYENQPITYWTTAVIGEFGEFCNMIKKLKRAENGGHDSGHSYTAKNITEKMLREEIGGTLIYIDLLCSLLNIDMEEAIIETFNEKSIELDFPYLLVKEEVGSQQLNKNEAEVVSLTCTAPTQSSKETLIREAQDWAREFYLQNGLKHIEFGKAVSHFMRGFKYAINHGTTPLSLNQSENQQPTTTSKSTE